MASDAGKPHADASTPAPTLKAVDRSGLSNVGTDTALDYDNPALWLCRPDIDPNECHADLDATELKSDGTLEVVRHTRAAHPTFDCFYLYPTVLLSGAPQMVDFSQAGVELVLDPLLAQAARFNSVCEVYAPFYRQAGLAGPTPAAGSKTEIALQDVRDAFAYYWRNFNQGKRNFVLMGHSQGTFMAASLLARDIEDNPELRDRLISALLLGGQPYVPPGKLVGGEFKNVPICSAPDETGCLIAFNSFAAEAPPTDRAVFSTVGTVFVNEPPDLSAQVACVNPAPLAGNSGRFAGAYFPLKLTNPSLGVPAPIDGVTTPFAVYRDLFRGECVMRDGHSYLEVKAEPPDDDKRQLPQHRNPVLESFGFGMHLVDYNLALDDLIKLVQRQAAAMR